MENQSLTFEMLKSMVGGTGSEKLPTPKQLLENDTVILESGSITVFKSGFFLCEEDCGYYTVFAVDRIRYLYYGTDKYGNPIKIYEEGFKELPWDLVLDKVAETRLEHNRQSRDQDHIEVYLYDEISEFNARHGFERNVYTQDRIGYDDIQDNLIAQEENDRKLRLLEEAKLTLTKRQREVLDLYYSENPMTICEIADVLGITFQGVDKIKNAAIEKLRKYFKKNG